MQGHVFMAEVSFIPTWESNKVQMFEGLCFMHALTILTCMLIQPAFVKYSGLVAACLLFYEQRF